MILELPEDSDECARIKETIRELKEMYPHVAFLLLNENDQDYFDSETDLFDPFIDMILADVGGDQEKGQSGKRP